MDPANLRRWTAFTLSILTLSLPRPAAARFGKASSGSRASSAGVHAAAPAPSRAHAPPARVYPRYYGPSYGAWHGHYDWYGYYPYPYEPSYGYPYAYPAAPYPYYPPPPPPSGPPSISMSFGADAALGYRGGSGAYGLGLAVDSHRFGINTQFTSIYLPAEVGFGGVHDNIGLLNLFATYSVVSLRDARLRLEAGIMSAFAADLVTAGPGFGISMTVGAVGPVGFEGAAHVTPYPFQEFDWNLGLVAHAGPAGIRGGWRRIWLDDRGLVDHISHQDVFSGPYLGLSFSF